jgi:hypothetical protein
MKLTRRYRAYFQENCQNYMPRIVVAPACDMYRGPNIAEHCVYIAVC